MSETKRTWIVKATDVPMMQARMPFFKLTREVEAGSRKEAIEEAKLLLHSGCVVNSASPKKS